MHRGNPSPVRPGRQRRRVSSPLFRRRAPGLPPTEALRHPRRPAHPARTTSEFDQPGQAGPASSPALLQSDVPRGREMNRPLSSIPPQPAHRCHSTTLQLPRPRLLSQRGSVRRSPDSRLSPNDRTEHVHQPAPILPVAPGPDLPGGWHQSEPLPCSRLRGCDERWPAADPAVHAQPPKLVHEPGEKPSPTADDMQ